MKTFALIVFAAFIIGNCKAQKPTGASVYDNCGQRNKKCFGDTDVCVEARNCTYAVSLTENRTHVDLILLNNCALPNTTSREYYLGVGLTTTDNQGNTECREPILEDFKVFILWNKFKCARKAFFYSEVQWMSTNKAGWKSNCEYSHFVNGSKPREEFNLGRYLENHIRLSSGDIKAPFNFADRVDYKVADRMLYINRLPATSEPPEAGFEIRPSNSNNNNNNAHGQPSNSQSIADDKSSSTAIKSLLNVQIFLLMVILLSTHY